jgi:mannitol/fructose-specific phosphotransferase system IIA component (Ntr-type)
MIRLRDALLPGNILLDLAAETYEAAIQHLAEPLRSDPRVSSWPELAAALTAKAQAPRAHLKYGVSLVHVRTAAVLDFVMTFGRLCRPVLDHAEPIQYILLIGIPIAMDAEYARLLGVLMRVLRDERLCEPFRRAQRPEEILAVFERGEAGLAS